MLLAIAFVLTLFGGRLVQLQGMQSAQFRNDALGEQARTLSLPGLRGNIYAADGQALAMTLETYTVTADPRQMTAADMPAYARQLARPLGLTSQHLLAMLRHPVAYGGEPAWMVLSPKSGVSDTVDEEITALDIPGITTAQSYPRVYPDGTATANVVGYATTTTTTTNGDDTTVTTGQQGIEAEYNSLLSGRNGREQVYTTSGGEPVPLEGGSITPATNGSSITLTINSNLQYDAQQACEAEVTKMHASDCTVVIEQPKTGDILAMAQWPPAYQPGAQESTYTWDDLPLQSEFEPGSTAKVITAAAAFEHGDPKQTPMSAYNIPYQILEGGLEVHDAEWSPGEHYTIAGIIANSSNIGMSQVANTITKQEQYDYLRNFGLGQPTGLDLPGEAEDYGNLPAPSQWWDSERYTLAYGQGVDANAVQMASVYATIANGGVRVQPRIVESITSPSGKKTLSPPSPTRRVIAPTTARELIQILQQVPGVDASAGIDVGEIQGYAIAAKTGTSSETGPECKPKGSLCEHGSSYIGMAPGNDPQVVVAVNVQDPDTADDYYGDEVAGPVFNTVMKFTIATLQIQPDDPTVPYVRLNAP